MDANLDYQKTSRSWAGSEMKKMPSRKRSPKKKGRGRRTKFTIPSSAFAWTTVLFCLFVISGGIYNVIENPPSYLPYYDKILTIDPRLSEQTVYESIFVFLTNSAMFFGFLLVYRSTQFAYDREKANRRLILGIGFIMAGLFGNHLIYEMKKAMWG